MGRPVRIRTIKPEFFGPRKARPSPGSRAHRDRGVRASALGGLRETCRGGRDSTLAEGAHVRTEELFRLFPDHRPRFEVWRLVCRCGHPFKREPGNAGVLTRSIRSHLFRLKNAEQEVKREAYRQERYAVKAAVERDRRLLIACGLSVAQFAFCCEISNRAARAWLKRRGLEAASGKRRVMHRRNTRGGNETTSARGVAESASSSRNETGEAV